MKNEREIRSVSEKIINFGCVCDACLGRQFAKLLKAGTNIERGRQARGIIGTAVKNEKCALCENLMAELCVTMKMPLEELKKMDFRTFMIGVRMSDSLVMKEEALWEKTGIKYCESIKAEISRELSRLVTKATGKKQDQERPDVIIMFDAGKRSTEIFSNPLFVYGEYRKFSRGLPQTSSRQFKQSVEDIIAKPLMKATGGSAHVLHAQGREDRGARCLAWRPFVLEIKQPLKRKFSPRSMLTAINRSHKVKVAKLRLSDRKEVAKIKAKNPFKIFRVVVDFEKSVENPERLKSLACAIKQRTPSRILGAKPDRTKHKKVKSIKWKRINSKRYQFDIIAESGLYLNELVTGDGGRTKPSVSQLLENSGKIKEFDLIGLED
jgi:tRNA pseudouridine synthase 10